MTPGTTVPLGVVVALAAAAGLAVGSFLNVVVYRVPRGLSVVRPRSFCPSCAKPVGSFDNVPVVSWLVLRGRCRRCGEPISVRYPLVELASGVLLALLAWATGSHLTVPGVCVLGATALAMVAVELDGTTPPASVAVVGTAIGAVLLAAAGVADRQWWRVGGVLIGVVVGAGAAVVVRGAPRAPDAVAAPQTPARPWSAILPVGALLGWLGPLGAGVGAGVVVLGAAVVIRSARTGRATPARDGPARTGVRGAGPAVVAAAGAAAGIIAVLAAGSPLGR